MIYIVGLGPGDPGSLTAAAKDRLVSGLPVLLRTERHPTVEHLRRWGVPYETCDDLYDSLDSYEAVYEAIAARVLERNAHGDVVYAVPGDPMVGEETVRLLLKAAQEGRAEVRVYGAVSFVEAVLAACGQSVETALLIVDALNAEKVPLPQEVPLLFYQVFDQEAASRVKLALIRHRPEDLEVAVVQHAGVAGEETVHWVPLYRMDRLPVDHLTAVYVPAVPPHKRKATFGDLVEVMRRLRAPGGCPWDRAQTHESLRKWLIEETYEAVEAIDRQDLEGLCEELGDVLLQIVFHAQLASEEGEFDIEDVIGRIVAKLVRRHPHVFGNARAEDPAAVERNWEAIKNAEKSERTSIMDGLPGSLPALHRAAEIGKRAAAVGFEWRRLEDVQAKVEEELGELWRSVAQGDREAVQHELGDLLFAITNIARWLDVDPEDALRRMLQRFLTRFERIEEAARASGRELHSMSLEEMDAIWNEAKANEP